MAFTVNPPNTPMVDGQGRVTPPWYRFFVAIQRLIGTSQTNPFDDSLLLATLPFPPSSDEAMDLTPPAIPVQIHDPLIPPAMPIAAHVDFLTPYRLPPGA